MSDCPNSKELGDFLAERLSPERSLELEAHIEQCLACQQTLEQLMAQAASTRQGGDADFAPMSVNGPRQLSTLGTNDAKGDRYTLTRMHAVGGLGRVWLAHDNELGRDVALKELRAGYQDSSGVVGRFLEEAQITGQLEHPGIVPVYDLVGSAQADRIFYTMRFVRGSTLAQAARDYHARAARKEQDPLALRELLSAFVSVCNTVAYAHSRGVLHRDLKGHNVIVGRYGEVIVLDWGLAKLVGDGASSGQEATASLMPVALQRGSSRDETVHGQVLGTPAYMAPEQAKGQLAAIDFRTDVYGLGAMLYEILTGRPPFSGTDTAEVLEKVRRQEPPPPRRLAPDTPPALEAICLKAMAKAPARRYATVEELAREVRSWLADEPVSAYREPWHRRAGRWLRRHRILTTSVAVLLITTIPALLLGTLLLRQANQLTQEQRDEARLQRDLARKNYQLARDAVDNYMAQVRGDQILEQARLAPLRKKLLQSGLQYYDAFRQQHANDPTLLRELAEVNYHIGDLTIEIGSMLEGQDRLKEAIQIWHQLDQANLEDLEVIDRLARCYERLTHAYVYTGQASQCDQACTRALELLAKLRASRPHVPEYGRRLGRCHDYMGSSLRLVGRYKESLERSNQAIQILTPVCEQAPDDLESRRLLALAYNNRAVSQGMLGKRTAQQQDVQQAITMFRALVKSDQSAIRVQRDLARSVGQFGQLHYDLGHFAQAEGPLDEGIKGWKDVVAKDPFNNDSRLFLGLTLGRLAEVRLGQGRYRQALALFLESTKLYEELNQQESDNLRYQNGVAWWYFRLGQLHGELGNPAEGVPWCEKAIRLQTAISARYPAPNHKSDELWSRQQLGLLRVQTGQTTGAAQVEPQLQIIREREQVMEQESGNPDWQFETADGYVRLAQLHLLAGLPGAARPDVDHALALLEKATSQQPDNFTYRRLQAQALAFRAQVAEQLSDLPGALQFAKKALLISKRLANADGGYWYDVAAQSGLAYSLARRQQTPASPEAETLAADSLAALRQALAANYDNWHRIQTDPLLASVRSRAEFPKLQGGKGKAILPTQ